MVDKKTRKRAPARKVAGPSDPLEMRAALGPPGDVPEGESVIVRLFDGRPFFAPMSWKLNHNQAAEVSAAQQIWAQMEACARELDELVPLMRQDGLSWARIGWCFGLSPEGARQRWGVSDE